MKHSKDESCHENITFPFDSGDPILHVKILSVHGDAYLHVAKQQMTHEDRWDRFFHLKNLLANDKRTKELVTYMRLKKYFNESDHDYGKTTLQLTQQIVATPPLCLDFYTGFLSSEQPIPASLLCFLSLRAGIESNPDPKIWMCLACNMKRPNFQSLKIVRPTLTVITSIITALTVLEFDWFYGAGYSSSAAINHEKSRSQRSSYNPTKQSQRAKPSQSGPTTQVLTFNFSILQFLTIPNLVLLRDVNAHDELWLALKFRKFPKRGSGVERLPEDVINLYEKAIQFYSSAYEISKNYKKYIYSFKKNKTNDSDEAGHIGDDDDEVNSACKKSLTKLANVHNEMATYYNKQLIKPGIKFFKFSV
ncbi:hypothetical protein HELRODRAFT_173207 [Helobdella robusta]|uniref:Uncharacterized protein n=1 Tax=Helobdella robusta TaxID=6412 RepID=T1F6K5_HELRO|nr:hypothetical protein HELRODRAFT_173207 [Helobdella robusta]ESO04119.1 hypothetical protein HELRODRAFT_173207 [Helobdella robusta]